MIFKKLWLTLLAATLNCAEGISIRENIDDDAQIPTHMSLSDASVDTNPQKNDSSYDMGSSDMKNTSFVDMLNDASTDMSGDALIFPNLPPTIELNPTMSRNIRIGTAKTLTALVADPEDGEVLCNWNFGDSTPETEYGACTTLHTYTSTGEYLVTARARDVGGLESEVSGLFRAYANIPPVAALSCETYDPIDALCVFRATIGVDFYLDGAPSSYDEDGTLSAARYIPFSDTLPQFGYDNPVGTRVGVRFGITGYFRGEYQVTDDEGATGSVFLYVDVTE